MSVAAGHQKLSIIDADIRTFDSLYLKGVHTVIDLSGLSNDSSAELNEEITKSINCTGGKRLACLAKEAGVTRYIYASSGSVYGSQYNNVLSEESDCNPVTLYSRCKLEVENYLIKIASHHFQPIIFRISTVFGVATRMRFDLVVNLMSLLAWKDGVIRINGSGDQWRPIIHVNDVVRAFVLGIQCHHSSAPNQIFNLGCSSMNYQIKDIADMVLRCFPRAGIERLLDAQDGMSYQLSFSKIAKFLGFEAVLSLSEGIHEVQDALARGYISGVDPTSYTSQWYRTLPNFSAAPSECKSIIT